MTKLSTKGLVVVALVLSLATAALVYSYLNNLSTRATKEGMPVVVAKAAIAPKTRITAEMVQEVKIPADYIQPGAMSELGKVVGVVAREPIAANEQITQRLLLLEGKSVGFTGIIPRDRRALSVAVNEVIGVAGFVKAGDYVDVIITFDKDTVGDHTTKVMLQNLQVLAANRDSEVGVGDTGKDKKDTVKASTVTLAVLPDEAAQLTLGEEKGKIRLALRPYLPSDGIVAVNAFTPKDLGGVQTSITAQNQRGDGSLAQPALAAPSSNPGIQVIRGTKVSGK